MSKSSCSRCRAAAVGLYTLLRKETQRVLRIWPQTLLPPAITMTLYFLVFGHIIGNRIGTISGLPYAKFIAPGLIMMAMITNAYANVSSSFFVERVHRSVEELLISPMPHSCVVLGFALGGVIRGCLIGTLVSCVALWFTHLHIHHLGVLILSGFLSTLLFSLTGLLNGLLAQTFDDVSIIPTFVLTPLTYLGGVFYSIKLLPEPWHGLSLYNPILYIVNTFRYSMLGVSDIKVHLALLTIAGCCILLFLACLHLLKKGRGRAV